jgi:hypothetical protein
MTEMPTAAAAAAAIEMAFLMRSRELLRALSSCRDRVSGHNEWAQKSQSEMGIELNLTAQRPALSLL